MTLAIVRGGLLLLAFGGAIAFAPVVGELVTWR